MDKELAKIIMKDLAWDSRVDESEIKLEISEDGEATLMGSVPSYYQSQAAEEDVWAFADIINVENQLTVKYKGNKVADSDILDSVKRIILWDANLNIDNMDISVDKGKVKLEGSVNAFWKKLYLERLVLNTVGVSEVENMIVITPEDDFEDELIGSVILDTLERRELTDPEEVTVEVNAGEVTLSGTLPDWPTWNSVYEVASFTKGVKGIHDMTVIGMDFE